MSNQGCDEALWKETFIKYLLKNLQCQQSLQEWQNLVSAVEPNSITNIP